MGKPRPIRFSIRPEDEAAAIAYLEKRGFPPAKVERDMEGLIVLTFPPLPDDQEYSLVQALPLHLSAKIGIVVGDRPPFRAAQRNIR